MFTGHPSLAGGRFFSYRLTKRADKDPWDAKSFWCYDTGWSHVGNTPFRLHKQNQHGGGMNTPMIAHWPAGIKAKPGSITSQRGHIIDFMATAIDLAGTEYPESWPGIDLEPLQGRSLKPIFEGKVREPHPSLFFRFNTNRAIIKGDWKLVTHRASRWELYNITKDGTELNDLAKHHPEKVKQLSEMWHRQATGKNRLTGKAVNPVEDRNPPLLKKSGVPAGGRRGLKVK